MDRAGQGGLNRFGSGTARVRRKMGPRKDIAKMLPMKGGQMLRWTGGARAQLREGFYTPY